MRLTSERDGGLYREHITHWHSRIAGSLRNPEGVTGRTSTSIIPVTAHCPHSAADPQLLGENRHWSGALPRICRGAARVQRHSSPDMAGSWRDRHPDLPRHSLDADRMADPGQASGTRGDRPPHQKHGRTQPPRPDVLHHYRQAGRDSCGNSDGAQIHLADQMPAGITDKMDGTNAQPARPSAIRWSWSARSSALRTRV